MPPPPSSSRPRLAAAIVVPVARVRVVAPVRTDYRPALAQRGHDGAPEVLVSTASPVHVRPALVAACLRAFFAAANDAPA